MVKSHKAISTHTYKLITFVLLFIMIILLIVFSKDTTTAGIEALQVWSLRLVPTMLPFMILCKLLISTSIPAIIGNKISGVTSKLYGVPGSSGYVYVLSILSGYPMNAKLLGDLYNNGDITSNQARTMATFTSVSGPLFIISTIGIGVYGNAIIGLIVLISHIIGSVLNGLIYRYNDNVVHVSHTFTQPTIADIILDSIQSMLIIGAYILLSFIVIQLMQNLHILSTLSSVVNRLLGVDTNVTNSILSGMIEITHGCIDLHGCGLSTNTTIILLTYIISFGGLSTILQGYTLMHSTGIKISYMLLYKFTQSIISAVVAILICMII